MIVNNANLNSFPFVRKVTRSVRVPKGLEIEENGEILDSVGTRSSLRGAWELAGTQVGFEGDFVEIGWSEHWASCLRNQVS